VPRAPVKKSFSGEMLLGNGRGKTRGDLITQLGEGRFLQEWAFLGGNQKVARKKKKKKKKLLRKDCSSRNRSPGSLKRYVAGERGDDKKVDSPQGRKKALKEKKKSGIGGGEHLLALRPEKRVSGKKEN